MHEDRDRLTLLDALAGESPYDPLCERVETAIKAIWLLYLRAKWPLLAQIGLSRAEFEPIFAAFDNLLEHRTLSTRDTTSLTRFTRVIRPQSAIRLLSGALWMIGRYRQRKLTYVGVTVRWTDTDKEPT